MGGRYGGRWESMDVLIVSICSVKQEARLPAESEDWEDV